MWRNETYSTKIRVVTNTFKIKFILELKFLKNHYYFKKLVLIIIIKKSQCYQCKDTQYSMKWESYPFYKGVA